MHKRARKQQVTPPAAKFPQTEEDTEWKGLEVISDVFQLPVSLIKGSLPSKYFAERSATPTAKGGAVIPEAHDPGAASAHIDLRGLETASGHAPMMPHTVSPRYVQPPPTPPMLAPMPLPAQLPNPVGTGPGGKLPPRSLSPLDVQPHEGVPLSHFGVDPKIHPHTVSTSPEGLGVPKSIKLYPHQ